MNPPSRPTWIEAIETRFPRLFRDLDPYPYGFDCGKGWETLVASLCEQLNDLALPRLRITQIKQKFGELRVYVEGGNEEVSRLIQDAEAASRMICEEPPSPDPRQAVLAFRETFQERFGSGRPADLDQVLGLARARHQAAALLLGMDPVALEVLLDDLVWRSGLSEEALADARCRSGLPISGSEDVR